MKYRKFGELDWMISELSIGVLRLEEVAANPDGINCQKRVKAIRYAIDEGVNYLNLGYPLYFENFPKVCDYIKAALADGYREKVKIAVNVSSRGIASQQDLDNALDEQLKLFDLDKADFCVIDDVYRATWDTLKSIDIATWASKAASSGKADYIGLSFHDDAYYLKEIHDVYSWAFIQVEFSILDYKHHPGVGGFKFTRDYNTAVIATDITKAGRLLSNIPANIREIWDTTQPAITPEESCIRWVLNFEEVSSAQMSMQSEFTSVQQIKKYIAYADRFSPGDADVWEILRATKVREAYYANRAYQCTSCRCCMPCNFGVDIPRIIELINDEIMFSDSRLPELQYNLENHPNIKCTQCGMCNKQCPKRFPLQKIVNNAAEKYANNKKVQGD